MCTANTCILLHLSLFISACLRCNCFHSTFLFIVKKYNNRLICSLRLYSHSIEQYYLFCMKCRLSECYCFLRAIQCETIESSVCGMSANDNLQKCDSMQKTELAPNIHAIRLRIVFCGILSCFQIFCQIVNNTCVTECVRINKAM